MSYFRSFATGSLLLLSAAAFGATFTDESAFAGPPSSYPLEPTPYTGAETWYCASGGADHRCTADSLFTSPNIGPGIVALFANPPAIGGFNRTFQSFGAAGDGVTDDTAAVQAALRSGLPITCRGSFLVASLVTVTNTNIYIEGGGDTCIFALNNSQSMFQFSEAGNVLYTANRVTLKGIRVKANAAITAVTGPAHTAAFFITYPLGTAGTALSPLVIVDDVRIGGTSATNYILNGLYLNDVNIAHVRAFAYDGNRTAVNLNSSAVVWDGTHIPTTLYVENSFADFAGNGVFAPQVAATGWQGIRVRNFDCVWCNVIVNAAGALDGSSDYLDVSGAEGPVNAFGVVAENVFHVFLHENYVFLYSSIPGLTPPSTPACFQLGWSIAMPPYSPSSITNNTCDGIQFSGAVARYGEVAGGISNTFWGAWIGTNTNSNLDIGTLIEPNTNGVTVYPQVSKNVTTPFLNAAAAGNITVVPPLAQTDGSAPPAGQPGEVQSASVAVGSGVALPSGGTVENIATLPLTAGAWGCSGAVGVNPAGSTINASVGAVSFISATLPTADSTRPIGGVGSNGAGAGVTYGLSYGFFNLSGSTPLYLVAQAFASGTTVGYGSISCIRIR